MKNEHSHRDLTENNKFWASSGREWCTSVSLPKTRRRLYFWASHPSDTGHGPWHSGPLKKERKKRLGQPPMKDAISRMKGMRTDACRHWCQHLFRLSLYCRTRLCAGRIQRARVSDGRRCWTAGDALRRDPRHLTPHANFVLDGVYCC